MLGINIAVARRHSFFRVANFTVAQAFEFGESNTTSRPLASRQTHTNVKRLAIAVHWECWVVSGCIAHVNAVVQHDCHSGVHAQRDCCGHICWQGRAAGDGISRVQVDLECQCLRLQPPSRPPSARRGGERDKLHVLRQWPLLQPGLCGTLCVSPQRGLPNARLAVVACERVSTARIVEGSCTTRGTVPPDTQVTVRGVVPVWLAVAGATQPPRRPIRCGPIVCAG